MPDPGDPNKTKTYYVPTAKVKNAAGVEVFETRIRSSNQNICACCKACCSCDCCMPRCCALTCCSCCRPCIRCWSSYQSCCMMHTLTGCFLTNNSEKKDEYHDIKFKVPPGLTPGAELKLPLPWGGEHTITVGQIYNSGDDVNIRLLRPKDPQIQQHQDSSSPSCCEDFCHVACPACYLCCCVRQDDPTYTIESQPIFRPGQKNQVPVGSIDSIWLQDQPISVTVNVPGANEEEQRLLSLLAYVIVNQTDPNDPGTQGFVHDEVTDFTNQYFSTSRRKVKFQEVLQIRNHGRKRNVGKRTTGCRHDP